MTKARHPRNKKQGKKRKAEDIQAALAAATRAIAADKNLLVSFDGNSPYANLAGGKLRLMPVNDKTESGELARIRGEADSAALYIKNHNPVLFNKQSPRDPKSAAIFTALEKARIEILGSRHMPGIRSNIAVKNERYLDEQGYSRLSERADPPVADMLTVMLHQKLEGMKPPEFMKNIMTLWGPMLEKTVGKSLTSLGDSLDNQEEFGKLVKDILKLLQMESFTEPTEGTGEEDDGEEEGNESEEQADDAAEMVSTLTAQSIKTSDTGEVSPAAARFAPGE